MTPPQVRVLTEPEIQERLYGQYLRHRKRAEPSAKKTLPTVHPVLEHNWTGVEILEGELRHLRSELISLKKEREHLATELGRLTSERRGGDSRPLRPILWGLVWVAILVGTVGYPVGLRLLQASPAGGELSPYTVQAAVYDVRPLAEQFANLLQELGYPAFLAETTRRGGKPRYRIYVGRFVTKQEAEAQRLRLTSDPRFSDAFVRIQ